MNSIHNSETTYDAVIIGAGIGGLVCGCYLAKSGMKVAIFELNNNPGGYCCSFSRLGYKFDVGAHYLGSFREGGQLNTIFKDLNLFDKVKVNRMTTADIIGSPDGTRIKITSDISETIKNFQDACPSEDKKKFADFFELICDRNFFRIINVGRKFDKFSDFTKQYFKHNRTLNYLNAFFGNCGSIDRIYTIPALVLYREFIIDGGYYPAGGFGKLAYHLADTFKSFGGNIFFGEEVTKVLVTNQKATGIETNKNRRVLAKNVISNCDVSHLTNKLLEHANVDDRVKRLVNSKTVSNSAFIVYIAIRDLPEKIKQMGTFGGMWWIPETKSKISDKYIDFTKNSKNNGPFFVTVPTFFDKTLAPSNHHIMRLQIIASFKNESFWKKNKHRLADAFIERAEKALGPFSSYIVQKYTGTPWDFYRYTLNKNGAMVGWAPLKENFFRSIRFNIENLYQVGHWCIFPGGQGGVAMAATTGKIVAQKLTN